MQSMVSRSPRVRRRLAWAAALAAVAGVAALLVALLPGGKRLPPAPLHGRATLPPAQVPLRPADRREIDRALDRFVVGAVAGRDPAAARGVLRAGVDPRTVYRFPARGTSFHEWTLNESTRNHVSLDLLVQPTARAARTTGPVVFTIRLDRIAGRWLVDSLVPTAIVGEHDVTSALDYSPGIGKTPAKASALDKAPLGRAWLAVPLAVLGLAIAFPLGVLLVRGGRSRRAWRRYRRANPAPPR